MRMGTSPILKKLSGMRNIDNIPTIKMCLYTDFQNKKGWGILVKSGAFSW